MFTVSDGHRAQHLTLNCKQLSFLCTINLSYKKFIKERLFVSKGFHLLLVRLLQLKY